MDNTLITTDQLALVLAIRDKQATFGLHAQFHKIAFAAQVASKLTEHEECSLRLLTPLLDSNLLVISSQL